MITIDTPVLGPVDTTAEAIVAAVYRVGEPAYSRELVALIATALVGWTRFCGLRTSIVAGQVLHETGYFQYGNQVKPEQFNFAGLGATNDGSAGASFASYEHGLGAVCAHHLVYLYGPVERWPVHLRHLVEFDPRYDAVLRAGYGGTVRVLGDLNGKWAYPGTDYGQRIAEIANTLTTGETMDLTALIGQRIAAHGIEVHDIRAQLPRKGDYPRLPLSAFRYTAIHYTASLRHPNTLERETASWRGHAVWHTVYRGWPAIAYAIGISQSGRVYLLRDIDEMGYHAFDANDEALGIACDMGEQEPTAALRQSLNAVLHVLHQETPELPNLIDERTYGHCELTFLDPRNDTRCPGPLLPFVQRYRDGSVELGPQTRVTFPTGISLDTRYAFYQYWQSHGGVEIFGYPITDEFTEDGATVQYFERARFEYRPDLNPVEGVMLGLVGSELRAAQARIRELEAALAEAQSLVAQYQRRIEVLTEKVTEDQ